MIDQIEYNRVVAENMELTKQRDELIEALLLVIEEMESAEHWHDLDFDLDDKRQRLSSIKDGK